MQSRYDLIGWFAQLNFPELIQDYTLATYLT